MLTRNFVTFSLLLLAGCATAPGTQYNPAETLNWQQSYEAELARRQAVPNAPANTLGNYSRSLQTQQMINSLKGR